MLNQVRLLKVAESDRAALERRVRDRGALAQDVQRARIVLLSTQDLSGPQIADRVGCTEPTVVLWRRRFAQEGLAGLDDRPRKPPPRTTLTDEVRDEILTAALAQIPDPRSRHGVRHEIHAILALAVCAVLTGARSFTAIAQWAADASPQLRAGLSDVQVPAQVASLLGR